MKKLLKKFLCVTLCVMLLAVGMPAAAETTEEEPIRILAIGNSYSNNATLFISRIAESMGKEVSVTSLYYAGCTLKQHVEFYNNDSRVYQFYVDGENITGWTNLNTMKEVFELYDYDYVTLQQSPSGSDDFSTYWTEEKPWLTDLYDIVKEHQPNAEIMVHQTWSFCHHCAIGNDPYWSTNYNNSKEMFDVIEDCYEQMADKIGVDKETGIIPVGVAIQLAKDEYGYGDFYNEGSGLTDAQHCENGALYTDNVDHLNWRGRYIAGCVWLEKIFGLDCRTATYFPEGVLTAEECEILRNIAHEAVTGEKAYIEGDWRVLPDGDGVEIVHYMGTVSEVGTLAVPETIGGKKVTRVDDTAFKYVDGLEKLILPENDSIVYEDGAIDNFNILTDLWDGTSAQPTEGLGTEESPYMIYNGSELYWAVTNENAGVHFKLANDILLNDILIDTENGVAYGVEAALEWNVGGAEISKVFCGVIDGNNHVIKGLYIDETFASASGSEWNVGAGLIARGGNGMKIKNLAIDNSYIRAMGAAASAFVGTTGSSNAVDLGFENCYIGEDVYIYGNHAGGFIGAGNGAGYVSGITNCYSLATIQAESFAGALSGGVWGGYNNPVTNFYATELQLHGQHGMAYTDCYAPARKADYDKVTVVTEADMQGQNAITKLSGLSDAYTLPAHGTPVLKSWVGKSNDVWSGFAATSLEGEGSEEVPYLITNGEEFAYMILSGGGEGKYYSLQNDIYFNDINGVNWTTGLAVNGYVPSAWMNNAKFNGYFDGNGHIVRGLYYPVGNCVSSTTTGYAGLFPQIGQNTHIKNLGVRNSYIDIFGHSAAIVGYISRSGTSVNILIDSCFSDQTVTVAHTRPTTSTDVCSGGIIGGTIMTPNITISNCYSLANLVGPYGSSKIVGSAWMLPETVVVENCYGDGRLWSGGNANNSVKTAYNCYSTVAADTAFKIWTQVSETDMQGANALTNMPLGDKYVTTEGYPMLKIFLGETEEAISGDVNGDGKVDTTDLAALKLYLAGVSDMIEKGADLDSNNKIDTGDLAGLKLKLAGV